MDVGSISKKLHELVGNHSRILRLTTTIRKKPEAKTYQKSKTKKSNYIRKGLLISPKEIQ